ncbi:glutamate--tRNA ligase [Candidatus Roizmanbacteria bacterium]|nr:glutamate--tRNA ligase [Candidatus Roizmanbacteria bacterium]
MVRTRIAPSPTGKDVHVGSIATGLMNFAWAKKNNGQFVIRIEDTDRTRLVEGGETKMLATLADLGLKADESPLMGGPFAPYRQSERLPIYKKYAEELIAKGKAYYCTCTPERLDEMRKSQQAAKQISKYDRHCFTRQDEIEKEIEQGAKHVVRLLMPQEDIVFTDILRGKITINGSQLDDQVLLKSDGFPTYHLAVVVDDHLMEITHIIRGEEWLPSTPKHVVLYRALGWDLPQYIHVSLLRNPDKSKLSKRKNPVWASDYLGQGILKEALLNYLALMGWSHPEGKDIFSLDEYVQLFDIKDILTTAPVFDPVKLEWMNGEYIRALSVDELFQKIAAFYQEKQLDSVLIQKTVPLIQERIKKLSDYYPLCQFFFEEPTGYEIDLKKYKSVLSTVAESVSTISDWKAIAIGEAMQKVATDQGIKNSEFFQMLRIAITGKKISPPLNESMEILGKEECMRRIQKVR